MKQTYLPEHFPQVKQDSELPSLKRKVKDSDFSMKTSKIEPVPKAKLNIPPSNISELSNETLNILQTLNIQSLANSSKNSEDILNSVSAREKYQDLLDPLRKLPLPYKYKRLLKLQEYIDTTINNAKIRKIPIAFDNIKQAIEKTYETCFELESLQRIMYLCPTLYRVYWEISSSEVKLIIDFPENSIYNISILHNRNSILNKELLELVKKYHKSYLFAKKIVFDPETHKTWHSSFDIHEVPDINLAALPEKCNEESPTVAKVSVAKQIRAARLVNLCKTIKKIFAGQSTPSIFLKGLVKKIQNEKGKSEDPSLIENDVYEICEIFAGWIGVIKTASGEVVRVNKATEFSMKAAHHKIKQKYN